MTATPPTADLPPEWRDDPVLHSGCMAGAAKIADLAAMLAAAGFSQIAIQPKDESKEFIRDWAPGRGVEEYLVSATIEALKPAHTDREATDRAASDRADRGADE